ncbi:MAG TPA: type IV toxin-antitoxin system AbiEi family antitoxin domain-containing protein [Streptosporangiaceae bacterium]|jgi:very-short-patch-repair endonuclease
MTDDLIHSLRVLNMLQAGVASREQVFRAGVTRSALDWQLRRGQWRQLHLGVYAMFATEPPRLATMWAGVLRAGHGAMLSHNSAAELDRLTDEPARLVHVTVPSSRRMRPVPGLVVHNSAYARRTRHPYLLPPRTRVEHTVLDLTELATTFDDACGWVTRACGRRLTTEQRLLEAMDLRAKLRWREPLTRVLADSAGGLHSVLELRYFRDVERAHGLPRAARQVRVVQGKRTQFRDVLYEKYLVIVELDGRLAHRDEDKWRDVRRDNAAAAQGCITLRYGWLDVTQHPCRTATEVAGVLRLRGYPSTPTRCSPECGLAMIM